MTPTRPWAAFQAVVWASSTLVQTPIALARVSASAAPPTTDPMIDQLEAAAAAASAAIAMSRSIRSCHRARMTLSTLVTAGQPHNVTRSGLNTGNGWQDLPADLGFLPEINLPALLARPTAGPPTSTLSPRGRCRTVTPPTTGAPCCGAAAAGEGGEGTARRTGVSRDASRGQNRGDPAGGALLGVNAQVEGGTSGPPNRTGTPSVTSTLSGGPDGWGRPVAATSSSFSSSTRASRSVHARCALGR